MLRSSVATTMVAACLWVLFWGGFRFRENFWRTSPCTLGTLATLSAPDSTCRPTPCVGVVVVGVLHAKISRRARASSSHSPTHKRPTSNASIIFLPTPVHVLNSCLPHAHTYTNSYTGPPSSSRSAQPPSRPRAPSLLLPPSPSKRPSSHPHPPALA